MYKTIILIALFIATNLFGDAVYITDYTKSARVQEPIVKTKSQDDYYSEKRLGSFFEDGKTVFRLFTPNAKKVVLITKQSPESKDEKVYEMTRDSDAVWEVKLDGIQNGLYYGYKVLHKDDKNIDDNPLCVDPYARAVATFNTFMNPRLSVVYDENFDWGDDEWIQRDWRDIVVYEMHVRDMTAHPSSGSSKPGTYAGLVESGQRGGIEYIKKLGVNTVELLPAHEFGNMEIPFEDSLAGRFNTWNPYERNHWGYMTSNFFAPAAYYAEDWKDFKRDVWMGRDGKAINEFKKMVKAFHQEGIGVMMDVVYNHLSEYELGNLKEIDLEYYFRLDEKGNCLAVSGCGNDIRTEAPMMRRLIVESILFWMEEYHVDGFRFDLGKLIDWQTIEAIIHEAKKINPNVVFVCEPWGGGYDPAGFSLRGWGAWNDQIRNGIKGENPNNGHGWIFGKWYGNNNLNRIKSYVNGTLVRDSLGLFQKKEHAVNYLESHDGFTLGDFIRIGTGDVKSDEIIKDVEKNAELNDYQLKLNKLGALFLFTSQGMTMIHSGQEFARSKVLPIDNDIKDEHKGMLDHNSYNKDNEVNYINFDHAEKNSDLFNYYAGLIDLREKYSAFRHAKYEAVKFIDFADEEFAFAYTVEHNGDTFYVAFNPETDKSLPLAIPEGNWELLVNGDNAGIESIKDVAGKYELTPVSGVVLKKK
ncbi:MAG: pullulanase [Melioribacteraceae bacterium]|nr:MAG: pullulanase [Melioribacteraceae bacterium]